ncbi:MAG: hypothetical protein KatS3mg011_0255 [Acidimicrobiia bacterium]|jgi:hypothetical protein|nr:MAG: hypothetical protein KatS3mg011_0255 [Acidimicrobiia bacterium]
MRVGNVLIGLGLALIVIGLLVRLGWFSWFGRLPGDIRIEGERSAFYAPITSMIVVSVVGSVLLNVFLRLFRGE